MNGSVLVGRQALLRFEFACRGGVRFNLVWVLLAGAGWFGFANFASISLCFWLGSRWVLVGSDATWFGFMFASLSLHLFSLFCLIVVLNLLETRPGLKRPILVFPGSQKSEERADNPALCRCQIQGSHRMVQEPRNMKQKTPPKTLSTPWRQRGFKHCGSLCPIKPFHDPFSLDKVETQLKPRNTHQLLHQPFNEAPTSRRGGVWRDPMPGDEHRTHGPHSHLVSQLLERSAVLVCKRLGW